MPLKTHVANMEGISDLITTVPRPCLEINNVVNRTIDRRVQRSLTSFQNAIFLKVKEIFKSDGKIKDSKKTPQI